MRKNTLKMASGGSSRPTGTIPKSSRNNSNIPQEVVTPTRRDVHSLNPNQTSVDWLPVSEHNTRPNQNRTRKSTNLLADNEFHDFDVVNQERGSRFVPVRPQPRPLVLRQRDNMGEHSDDSFGNAVGNNSPHTSHAAIMIVNPTTPNSNQTVNVASSTNRNNARGSSIGRDMCPVYASNTVPVSPHPPNGNTTGNKCSNLSQSDLPAEGGVFQNGNSQSLYHEPQPQPWPDAARVEQRLGQIREYIRVTSSLVESMRNSEDELKKRIRSLKQCNAVLAAQARAMDGEDGEILDQTEHLCEFEELEDEQEDSDIVELLETLANLKDSEKKLEEMLQYLDERVHDANNQIKLVCNGNEDDQFSNQMSEHQAEVESTEEKCADEESDKKQEEVVEEDKVSGSSGEYVSISDITLHSEQDGAARPISAQSGFSAFSDNDLYANEMKTNMDLTQIRLAAALLEQKRLLKYQAEVQMCRNSENMTSSHNDLTSNQEMPGSSGTYPIPPNAHQPLSSAKVYGINQIGVATTLPHVTEHNYNWNNQGVKRSSDGDFRQESSDSRSRTLADQSEIDMLRDLRMRRHHLENQVSKIQNLHTASSLMENVSNSAGTDGPSDNRQWVGSDAGEEERMGQVSSDNSIRSKVATVNVMKAELERLKSMLRTVDSIQSNFGVNASIEDEDNMYESESNAIYDEPRNRNRMSESSTHNAFPLSRRDSSSSAKHGKDGPPDINHAAKTQNVPVGLLSRLQNCITVSNKCTNVSEPLQTGSGDYMGSELLAIQQLTDELRQAAQGLSEERRRLKHVSNKDACTSSGSSVKSEDKKISNSVSCGKTPSTVNPSYPSNTGPLERKQLALKAELEAKKRQLERLMSKEVDHRTNQQAAGNMQDSSKELISAEVTGAAIKTEPSCSYQNTSASLDGRNGYYSSEPEEDETYLESSNNQLNINQCNEEPSQKEPSRDSTPDNLKDEPCFFGDSTQSLDGSFASQSRKHNQLLKINKSSDNKQRNKGILPIHTGLESAAEMFQHQSREAHGALPEVCVGGRALSQDRVCLTQQQLTDRFMGVPMSANSGPKDVCDVSNMSNASSSSSGDDRDPVPPPMASLPTRQRNTNKSNRDNVSVDGTPPPPQWNTPQMESQVTMWWHNKANQLQQQLELTTNLCQSLLQDKRTNQTSPSTLSSFPNPSAPHSQNIPNNVSAMLPGVSAFQQYQSNPMLNANNMGNPYYPFGSLPVPGFLPLDITGMPQMWSFQQQQIAAQQQQVAAAAWGSAQCVQHLLTQQREISLLRNTLSNLEERLQILNMNTPRAHSTPPNINCPDNNYVGRMNAPHFPQVAQSVWANSQCNSDSLPHNAPSVQTSNTPHRPASKLVPSNAHTSLEHYGNQQLPANFSSNNTCQYHDSVSDQISLIAPPNNMQLFNNNPHPCNAASNQSAHVLQSNRNLPQHAASMSNVPPMGQPLTGQSMALNNQVPPGIRANNYWDNFRSYSRQNLLSGNTKANAGIGLTHSPHPLVERSHNTLHTGTPPGGCTSGVTTNTQVTNTPKRDVNLQGNAGIHSDHDLTLRRGRRNLSQDVGYFTAPPDVLNVNQNVDSEQNQQSVNILSNTEMSSDNRLHSSHNVNINISSEPIPEIIQAHSNNLNVPRSYGAYKKKSSSKLPTKNACNTRNYSTTNATHNRFLEPHGDNADPNPNLASTSSDTDQEKSTTKLFDLLRENVYSEVTALISANESHPHFLIQLFRDLQQISSDPLRQRALQSIQDLVSHYLSNVEADPFQMAPSGSTQTGGDLPVSVPISHHGDTANSSRVDNQIIKYILSHHGETCTQEILEDLCQVIVATIGDDTNITYISDQLKDNLVSYLGCKVSEVGDQLVMAVSSILVSLHTKVDQQIRDEVRENHAKGEGEHPGSPYSEERQNESNCIHDQAVGPLGTESAAAQGAHEEASGTSLSSQRKQDSNSFMPDLKIDLIENVENYNGDLAEADQSRHGSETTAPSTDGTLEAFLPDVVDTEEQTPTEAEAEWLGLDHVPTRLQMEDNPENQSDGGS